MVLNYREYFSEVELSKKLAEKPDDFVGGPIFALFSKRNSIMELQRTPTKPMVRNGSKPSGTFFRGHISKKMNLKKNHYNSLQN